MTEINSTYHLDEPATDIYVGDCREILYAGLSNEKWAASGCSQPFLVPYSDKVAA